MKCLDHSTPPPTTAITQARERGWAFGWSERYQEVVMFAATEETKRRIQNKYRAGVAVYTLAEIEATKTMSVDEQAATHLFIREFGAYIE